MLQTDGSPHDWLEGRGPKLCLLGVIDDATNKVPAGSPQAKGRIERLWGTFQDRLISELRLADARTKKEAQAALERFLPEYNRRFGKKPACMKPAWRKLDGGDLKRILCWKYKRTVAKDNTISFKGLVLQLPRVKPLYSLAGKKATVLALSAWSSSIPNVGCISNPPSNTVVIPG